MLSDPQSLVGTKLGNYRLERLLGRGRMGIVYLAHDEALLRPTAVKVLSWLIPEQYQQSPEAWFLSEARNVARFNHPHVVQIYGIAKHGPYCYIAMEYVDGAPSDVWVAKRGRFTPESATEILLQTANALQAAHDANVVHRDIKPENLLLASDGTAKLGDFGMALSLANGRAPDSGRAGTPLYTAPEMWRGQPASVATDIYALGATYYYLIAGRPPFFAPDLQSLITEHLQRQVPDLQNAIGNSVPECNSIVQRCLAKSPSDRYPSAREISWDARGCLSKLRSGIKSPTPTQVQELHGQNPAPPSSARTSDDWREFFGFTSEPFGVVEPQSASVTGEPFSTVLQQIGDLFRSHPGCTVVLTGELGSGRTTVAKHLLSNHETSGLVAYFGHEISKKKQPLVQQVSRAFGVGSSSNSDKIASIDALLDQLSSSHLGKSGTALLVLDDSTATKQWLEDLATLRQAALRTRYFSILLVGTPVLLEEMCEETDEKSGIHSVAMPSLTVAQTLHYIDAWTRGLAPGRRVLITVDAGLLIADRSRGNLGRTNEIALTMLSQAAREKRRVLDSWDAWRAISADAGAEREAMRLAQRPEQWPTPAVLRVLNEQRRKIGTLPRQSAITASR